VHVGVEVRLGPSGRRVWLKQLHVLATTTDWSDPADPKTMDRRLPALVDALLGGVAVPFLTHPVRSNLLPPVTCIALFESEPMGWRDVAVQGSELIVCWFTERADTSIRQLACEALAGVDWERHARDYHSEW
jgi:hypothetical protein